MAAKRRVEFYEKITAGILRLSAGAFQKRFPNFSIGLFGPHGDIHKSIFRDGMSEMVIMKMLQGAIQPLLRYIYKLDFCGMSAYIIVQLVSFRFVGVIHFFFGGLVWQKGN